MENVSPFIFSLQSLMFCCISVAIWQMSHESQVVASSEWAEEISTHLRMS